jgi:hypothetical protein
MKKLLLFPLLTFAMHASAQYHPMLADSNTWAMYNDIIPLLLEPHSTQVLNQNPAVHTMMGPGYVKTVKDTVVGAHTYVMFFSNSNQWSTTQWSLLREDSATQKVYLLSAGDTAERIIYDFSLNTGDSIWLDFYYQPGPAYLQSGWWYVDSTSTYMIETGPRKALYLSNPMNTLHNGNEVRFMQWIESVGCNISPVYLDELNDEATSPIENAMGPGCDFNTHSYSVTCAWHDSTKIFNSPCWENVRQQMQLGYINGDSCVFMLMGAVEDPSLGIERLQLMPNPANGNSTLHFTTGTANVFAVNIVNMLGETVQSTSASTWYAKGAHTMTIDLTGFAPGIYSVNLIGATGRMSVKLIVH